MSNVAVSVENLGKQYRIGQAERYKTLRDSIMDTIYAPFRGLAEFGRVNSAGSPSMKHLPTIWALKDVTFQVSYGEAVGIIGRNGAGKSTLLKLISRITEPTLGSIDIYGRVGSLLEVGTGFHPELTGRENIYLNGAILGMRRTEIESKFDEIVAFSEIEKFLDTPVKFYSSGMYMRLAFSVAAHLEPEILLVDEVLAVGDAAFQKKCIGKMGEVAHEGRAVMVVSHNMEVINNLTTRALLLDSGNLVMDGTTSEVVSHYLKTQTVINNGRNLADRPKDGTKTARFLGFWLSSPDGEDAVIFSMGNDVVFNINCEFSRPLLDPYVSIEIYTSTGAPVYQLINIDGGVNLSNITGEITLSASLHDLRLYPGLYYIKIGLCDHSGYLIDYIESVVSFEVVPGENIRLNRKLNPAGGVIYEEADWSIKKSTTETA
jgi:lipopolysaccharide transport system ATP-binding protein